MGCRNLVRDVTIGKQDFLNKITFKDAKSNRSGNLAKARNKRNLL